MNTITHIDSVYNDDGSLNRISIIKAVRSVYFLSLKDAKTLVDIMTDSAERMRPSILDESKAASEIAARLWDYSSGGGLNDAEIAKLQLHLSNITRIASIKGI